MSGQLPAEVRSGDVNGSRLDLSTKERRRRHVRTEISGGKQSAEEMMATKPDFR